MMIHFASHMVLRPIGRSSGPARRRLRLRVIDQRAFAGDGTLPPLTLRQAPGPLGTDDAVSLSPGAPPSGKLRGRVMILALYCPDIAQNAGTCLRTGACLGVPVHIIEPSGFPVGNAAFRRAGMDYVEAVEWVRHDSFVAFEAWRESEKRRLVLFTTRGASSYADFTFRADDVLLFGRESAGVPDAVHDRADARLVIPLRPGMRSLNVAVSAGIALAEGLRQTGHLPALSLGS